MSWLVDGSSAGINIPEPDRNTRRSRFSYHYQLTNQVGEDKTSERSDRVEDPSQADCWAARA